MFEAEIEKRPYKFIQIPLNKFRDEVIPHHQLQFEAHKNAVEKCTTSNSSTQLQRDLQRINPTIRQLKNLVYELDALRTQVFESDLTRFDAHAASLKKEIYALIQSYLDLDSQATTALKNVSDDNLDDLNTRITSQNCQLLLDGDFCDLQSYDENRQLERLEALNKDIKDVHEIFGDLHSMVEQQKESVNVTESNIEAASVNTKFGLKHLIQASKWKAASIPVTGAFIGTMVGGPIGSLAGFKIGAVAAIGFGVAGYVGGKFVKKKKLEADSLKNEIEMTNHVSDSSDSKKVQ